MTTPLSPLPGRMEDETPAITRRDLVRVLFKRRWTIVACFIIVTSVTAGGVALLPPTYEAQAKVLVQTERQIAPTFFTGLAATSERQEWDPINRRLENEMALIGASPIAGRIVDELGLDWHEIHHPPLTHLIERLVARAGPLLESSFGIPYRPPSKAETIAALQASVGVKPGESRMAETTSNIIVVTLKSPDAETSRAALARMLELYLSFEGKLRDQAGKNARALVARELTAANREVGSAERRMRDFLAESHVESDGAERERRVDPRAPGDVVTSARDTRTIVELKARLVGLESELADTRLIYRPEADIVRRLEQSVALIKSRLSTEIELNARNFALHNQLDRTLRAAETRSDELDRRLGEIDLFLQINKQSAGNRVVIEHPILPEKSDWKARLATVLLGLLMGLIVGLAFAGLGEYADSSLGSKEDVRRHVGVDVIATVPKARSRELKSIFQGDIAPTSTSESPAGRLAAAAEALASRLTAAIQNGASPCANTWSQTTDAPKHGRSVLVTSARPREGKTVVATLLTGELVRLGYGTVLLVDLNDHGHRPRIDPGVLYSRILKKAQMLDTDRAATGDEGRPVPLTVLAGGNGHASAAELVGVGLRAFLEREAPRFDWIVFDGRSVEGRGMTALAQQVDAVLLVVEADTTRRHVVQHAVDVLDLHETDKIKIVLNRKRYHIPGFLYERV